MQTFFTMTKRNIKMFFKDKGMFFTSLITPLILLILYATFLSNVFTDTFSSALPQGFGVSDKLIGGTVAGQLLSSLLSVCPITVAFCSGMLSVQDKVSGAIKDFDVTPVKKSVIALSYYVATLITTLIVAYIAAAAGLIYVAIKGWYMSFGDVMYIVLDVFLLSMFGTAITSLINIFLTSQGQISAVSAIVSAGYGFICGAYMPMSSFGDGLQKTLSFLPGTYGTSLLRNHALNGVFKEMSSIGFPDAAIAGLKDSVDCNIYFFGDKVEIWTMYVIMAVAVLILVGAYILVNFVGEKRKNLPSLLQKRK